MKRQFMQGALFTMSVILFLVMLLAFLSIYLEGKIDNGLHLFFSLYVVVVLADYCRIQFMKLWSGL